MLWQKSVGLLVAAFQNADALERLAKRKAAKQLGVSAGIGSGVTVKFGKPNVVQSAVRGLGAVYSRAKNQPGAQISTPINTGSGVSMGGQQNALQNVVEPTRLAVRRAVGDIAAIPGVGKPSASPTAADIRSGNWAAPAIDYGGLALEILPSIKPAAQELKLALTRAIEKSIPKPPPLVGVSPMRFDPISPDDYMKLTSRARNMRFRADQFPELFGSAKRYWHQDYPMFQSMLREPNDILPFLSSGEKMKLKTDIAQIDELFKKAPPLDRPALTYRGIKRFWRNNNSDFMKMLDDLKPGDTFVEPGFSSTTIDPELGKSFADRGIGGYVLEVEIPQGSKVVSPLHGWPYKPRTLDPEKELLLPRNSKYEVLSRNGDTIRVRLIK